jgi:lipopolysaccharide export system protein LptA
MKRRLRLVATVAILAAAMTTSWGQGAPMFGGFLDQSDDPISIDANSLQWLVADGRDVLEYRGSVVAVRGNMTIEADLLIVYLPLPDADNAGAFDRLEASGAVTILAGSQRVTSQSAIIDMVAQTVTMDGNVALNDGGTQMAGDHLAVDLTTGDWRLDAATPAGRVRTTVNPR